MTIKLHEDEVLVSAISINDLLAELNEYQLANILKRCEELASFDQFMDVVNLGRKEYLVVAFVEREEIVITRNLRVKLDVNKNKNKISVKLLEVGKMKLL